MTSAHVSGILLFTMIAVLGHAHEHYVVRAILIKKRWSKKNSVVSGLDFFLYLVTSLLFARIRVSYEEAFKQVKEL